MQCRRRGLRFGILAALILFACSNLEKEKAKHFERGQEYLAQGKTDAAILELRNALRIDPRDAQARDRLARAYLQRGDSASRREALALLRVVLQEDPDLIDARLTLVELLLQQGNATQALDHSKIAVGKAPEDPRVQLLYGRSLLATKRTSEATRVLEKAAKMAPKAAEPRIHLARALMVQNEHEQAKRQLERAIKLDPKSSAAQLALGDYYARRTNGASAEKAYRRALEIAPDDEAAFVKLAGFLFRSGKTQAAESVYVKYATTKPDDPRVHIILGDFYAEQGERKKAVEHLNRALELDPDAAMALDRLLGLKLESGDLSGVRRTISELRARQADHPIAAYYEARLELTEEKYDAAIQRLRQVIKEYPQLGGAQLTLGTALAAGGDRSGAERALEKAATIDTVAADALWELAKLHLTENKVQLAVSEARSAHERNPGRVAIAATLAHALARSGRLSAATQVLTEAAERYPKDPRVPHGLGRLALAQREAEQAARHFERALKLDPRYEAALRDLAMVYLEQKKTARALELVEAQNGVDALEYHLLRGQIFEATGKVQEAEAAYAQAMDAAPVASDAYSRLAMLYLRSKQVKAAKERYVEEADQDPKRLGPQVILGILYHVTGNVDEATRRYEAALAITPKAAIASNNLASILAEREQELDRALQLAVIALRERPGDANVLDTIGRVYYQKKRYQQAISLLGSAHRTAPGNNLIAYHYGLALAAVKQRKHDAIGVLERVLKRDPRFHAADEINVTLTKLRK